MRWHSTQESVRRAEPSVLAIVETFAAISTSVWIASCLDSWWHVVAGFCIAPFLLLRTDESCVRALNWHEQYVDRFTDRFGEGAATAVVLLTSGVVGLVLRVGATVVELTKNPLHCFGAVTGNWWRMVCSVDFSISPESLPFPQDPSMTNVDETPYKTYILWPEVAAIAMDKSEGWRRIYEVPLVLVYASASTFVAVAYRWSVKSTAIGWLPLLWALKPAKPQSREWKPFLSVEWDLKKPQLVAVWSTLCLLTLAFKYGLWAAKYELALKADALRTRLEELVDRLGGQGLQGSPLADAAVSFVRPGEIPIWQIAIFLNSLLGLYIWWAIRHWLAEYKHNVAPSDESITRTINATFFARHLLTSYVIICEGFILLQLARNLPMPQVGSKVFPWL
jgi:hypothetical protein